MWELYGYRQTCEATSHWTMTHFKSFLLHDSYIPVGITEYQGQKVYLGIVTKHKKSTLVSRG